MYTIFDEYFLCLVHDILNDQLNEDNTSQLIPVDDSEFVYRNLSIPNGIKLKEPLNLVIDGKQITSFYRRINNRKFKSFLYENIKSQANDGISANIGKSAGMENLTANMNDRLNGIVTKLKDKGIDSSFSQVYYENDVKTFHNKIKNTFALARFNVGFLKQHGIKVLRTANNTSNPHVVIVSEKLEEQVSNYVKNKINGKQSGFNILDTNEQNDVYNFLKNIIYDDIKTSTYVPLSYNPKKGVVDRKDIEQLPNMENHCVFTSIFHRAYLDILLQKKHLTHSVCYDGDGFIIFEYKSEMDDYISDVLQELYKNKGKVTESFRSFLERKGILESLYKW